MNYSTSDILIPSPKYIEGGIVHLRNELLHIWCTVRASARSEMVLGFKVIDCTEHSSSDPNLEEQKVANLSSNFAFEWTNFFVDDTIG